MHHFEGPEYGRFTIKAKKVEKEEALHAVGIEPTALPLALRLWCNHEPTQHLRHTFCGAIGL